MFEGGGGRGVAQGRVDISETIREPWVARAVNDHRRAAAK